MLKVLIMFANLQTSRTPDVRSLPVLVLDVCQRYSTTMKPLPNIFCTCNSEVKRLGSTPTSGRMLQQILEKHLMPNVSGLEDVYEVAGISNKQVAAANIQNSETRSFLHVLHVC